MHIRLLFALSVLALPVSTWADIYSCEENGSKVLRSEPCAKESVRAPKSRGATTRTIPADDKPSEDKPTSGLPSPHNKSARTDPECRFSYYVYGDEKGKALAANAKEECLRNKILRRDGQAGAMTLDAYRLWKDHFEIVSNNRNQAINRANSYRDFTCTSNGTGGLRCN